LLLVAVEVVLWVLEVELVDYVLQLQQLVVAVL
jgi:hypothetical protein